MKCVYNNSNLVLRITSPLSAIFCEEYNNYLPTQHMRSVIKSVLESNLSRWLITWVAQCDWHHWPITFFNTGNHQQCMTNAIKERIWFGSVFSFFTLKTDAVLFKLKAKVWCVYVVHPFCDSSEFLKYIIWLQH